MSFDSGLSQSERHVKETKSKCKRIALLLTNAPNPQNKGALLFKKRQQRVKNYTLVSYGTSGDSKDRIEEEELTSTGYNFIATSDSELEEGYSVYHQQCQLSVNWESLQKMEGLPETKGKGALMFAQRRQRMDEIVSEHEELRSKGLPVEGVPESQHTAAQNIYDTTETYMYNDQADYPCADVKQQVEYQENLTMPKPLVPNRTAKPFLGFQVKAPPPVRHSVVAPVTSVTKKPEPRFKVPVPSITSPHVWSPTGDIIASRDERISVPAIKTGILPESKRKGTYKQSTPEQEAGHLQNKGERRSFIECEEDCFSLGAEACNFMQPKTIKHKNPPPVAPKPTINPACPPWIGKSPLDEPFVAPRSPISQPYPSPIGPHSQNYLQPHDWVKPQQMSNHWAQDQTAAALQTSTNKSSQLHPQPARNSWSLQQPRSPVSMQARSPSYSPQPPPLSSRKKTDSVPNSVTSCPPPTEKTYMYKSKTADSPEVRHNGQAGRMAGKGAELFAKRQSRMEKFVVDAGKVQVKKERAPSPTSSLPNSWRYSSNIRAPPPLSYNPLLSPFYPPAAAAAAAAKQPPSTSPKIKPKTKQKPKAAPKHLNALDIMKHQPYQLDSSLFKYEAVTETKSPSPKPSPTPKSKLRKGPKHKSAPSHSPRPVSEPASQAKPETTAKSSWLVGSPGSSTDKPTESAQVLDVDKHQDEKHTVTPALNHISSKQAPSNRPASTSSQLSSISSISDSIAAAFSPASLIARGVRQMAPRPRFSAKKQVVAGKQLKPVAVSP